MIVFYFGNKGKIIEYSVAYQNYFLCNKICIYQIFIVPLQQISIKNAMKKVFFIAIIAMCMIGCNQNEPEKSKYMSVANKIFYQEGYSAAHLSYLKFTNDSVFYKQITYEDKGVFSQTEDIVTIKLEKSPNTQHAQVKDDMLVFEGNFYTQNDPDY